MNHVAKLATELCPEGVPYKSLDFLAKVNTGSQLNRASLSSIGKYPVMNGGISPSGFHEGFNTEGPVTVISQGGASAGYVTWMPGNLWVGAHCYVIDPKTELVDSRFLYHFLKHSEYEIQGMKSGAGIPGLNRGKLIGLRCPVPPMEVQREIVKILDTFTGLEVELEAELNARKSQYSHYRAQLLSAKDGDPEIRWVPMGDIAQNRDSLRKPVTKGARKKGEFPYYGASGIVDFVDDYLFDGDYLLVSEDGANLLARSTPIAFSISGKNWVNNHAHVLEFETYELRRLTEIYLNSIDLSPYVAGGAQPKLSQANLNKILVPVPPVEEMKRKIAILDAFEALLGDNSMGLPSEISARRQQFEYYRTKLLTFKKLEVA
jgi:type I restriction enzyme S subunit